MKRESTLYPEVSCRPEALPRLIALASSPALRSTCPGLRFSLRECFGAAFDTPLRREERLPLSGAPQKLGQLLRQPAHQVFQLSDLTLKLGILIPQLRVCGSVFGSGHHLHNP